MVPTKQVTPLDRSFNQESKKIKFGNCYFSRELTRHLNHFQNNKEYLKYNNSNMQTTNSTV